MYLGPLHLNTSVPTKKIMVDSVWTTSTSPCWRQDRELVIFKVTTFDYNYQKPFLFFFFFTYWSIPLRLKKTESLYLLKETTNWSILVVVRQLRHRAIVLFSGSPDRREGPSSALFQDPERSGSETRPPILQARFLPVVLTAGASLPVRLFARTELNKCQLKKLGKVDL